MRGGDRKKMNKDKLIKSLEYLRELPPSKWNPVIITRFKLNVLDDLIEYIKTDGKIDQVELAKKTWEL